MKLTADDITPDLLRTVLRDMTQESPSTPQKQMCQRLTDVSIDNDDVHDTLQQMALHILNYIPSCFPDAVCNCQLKGIIITGICLGVMMGNTQEDVKSLARSM